MHAQRVGKARGERCTTRVSKRQQDEVSRRESCRAKGLEGYVVETARKMVERLGYRMIIMRSDSEPAILALKQAVRRESDVEIVLEDVPVGGYQANGWVENAVKHAQRQIRVIKDALESN